MRTAAILAATLLLGTLPAPEAAAADTVTPQEVAQRLGLSDSAIAEVKKGGVVTEELKATTDKDLALAVVALADATPKEVWQFVEQDRMAQYDTITLAHGDLDPKNPSLAKMTLDDETLEKLAKEPGDLFNLADAEAKQIREAGKQGKQQALAAYRKVLEARARDYWQKGIAGIEAYADGGKGRDPKVDLKAANDATKKLVENALARAELDVVPAENTGKAEHSLSWAVQKSRDQAAPVLIHRILVHTENAELFVHRRFYSGYDYDSLQVVTGVLPTKDGRSAVFYTNHTYTPQVAGFGGSAKRSIGRKMMKGKLVEEMESAQKAVAKK